MINVFLMNAFLSFGQTTQSLQVGIIPHSPNNRFCTGSPEDFTLEAGANGGTEPYFYEWTFSWRPDTLRTKTITVRPTTSGEVKLKVTDSSRPPISRDTRYQIYEIILNAGFTFQAPDNCAQTPVKFTSTVSGGTPAYSYLWTFGDGTTSTLRDPVHEFAAPGCSGTASFNVRMTVTDADGCSTSVTRTVTVNRKPQLVFDDTQNPYSPFKHCPEIIIDPAFDVELTNRTVHTSCITSYKIDWGDGTIINNATFPIRHTYTKVGAFQLVVTAENTSGCALVWNQYVYNQSSPAAGIESFGGTEGCAPIEFAFALVGYENNSIGTTYTWSFGDGTPNVVWNHGDPYINDTIRHLYNFSSCENPYGPGYFSTSVTVRNGCDTKTAVVDKVRIWSKPEASIGNEELPIDTICINETIQLTNNSVNGYYGNNCTRLTQYSWDFDNGRTSTAEVMPPMSWSVPGVYDIVLRVSNPCGATADTFKIVVIEPPVARASVDNNSGCTPFRPKFTNSSTGQRKYLWEVMPDSGFTFLNGTSEKSWEPQISFNQRGTYRVVLYISNTCRTDSVVFNFNVFTRPEGRIENLSDICITNPVIHPSVVYENNGSQVRTFNWTFPGATPASASTMDPGPHTYTTPGEYTVSVALENACGISSISDNFLIYPVPEVTVNTPVSICASQSLTITGTRTANVTSIKWHTRGDGYFSNDTLANPVYHPGRNDIANAGAILQITAEGIAPCGPDTALLRLSIQREPRVRVDDDVSICEGLEYRITNTTAENYSVLKWSTTGDGHFSNPDILLPTYFPGSNDITRGHVELSLTAQANAPCTVNASDTLRITYVRVPVISAGPDRDICQNGQVSLTATGTGFNSVRWNLISGQGTFSDNSNLTPVFTLGQGNRDTLIVITIDAAGGYGCPAVHDTLKLSVIPLPSAFAGDNAVVCETGSYKIPGAAVYNYFNYSWTVNGDGSLDNNSLIDPVYTPGQNDIINGRVTLTLTAEGKSVCPDVSDEISIFIQKLPVSDAGSDQEICKSSSFTTRGSQLNGTSYQWMTLGTGTFGNSADLVTAYYPSDDDTDSGRVHLVLKVDPLAPCLLPDYDTLLLTFIDPPVISAGNDTTICSASFIPVKAYALNSTQYEWSSSGSGTWSNPNIITPVYFPSASDIAAGSVILTLTSRNPSCPVATDNLRLTMTPFPVSEAGQDDLICEDEIKQLSDSYIANYSSIEWRTSGDGSFDNIHTVHPAYRPGINDIAGGSVKLYLVAGGVPPCNTPGIDSLTLSIQKNPSVYAGTDTIIGEREEFTTIEARAANVDRVSWHTTGDGTFLNGSGIISTYIHGPNDLLNESVSLIIRGTALSPCMKIVTDTIHLSITPVPIADAGSDERICEGSNVTITTASAEKYSEIWWTTPGSGTLDNSTSLTPTYHPGNADIENRSVVLVLHARGKDPIENYVVSDSMTIEIIHNVYADAIPADTACVNSSYRISDIIYRDVNMISWRSSGNGNFDAADKENPVYVFSSDDKERDTIYFYVRVTSISPCVLAVHDTMMIRLYHEPEPSFDYDNPEGCAPLNVSFTNTTEGEELTYLWNFGNGLTSSDENPSDIMFSQGRLADTTYSVILTATNRCSSVSAGRDVIVKPVPIASFGMDVSWGCSPKEIKLFNVTTGLPETFTWKWGDGEANSTQENPGSHIFRTGISDTTYMITLIAENECGVDSIQKSVIIFPNIVRAFFESDTTLGCAPLSVSFTNYSRGVLGNTPFLNWSWNFGDGNVTDVLNPVHVFEEPGKYTVTLYVNDTCSHDSFTTEIHVLGAPAVDFVADKSVYCDYDTISLTPVNMPINEIAGVIWDFGDANLGSEFNAQHLYDQAGTYTITLTGKDIITGCTASTSRDITIHKSPVAAFSILEDDGYHPLDIVFVNETTGGKYFTWDFGDDQSAQEINPWHRYDSAGTYIVILTASDDYGCTNTISDSISFEFSKGLYMPNALSPESPFEGVREFKAIGAGLIEFHLVIYDTWGNLIWETSELDKGVPVEAWDGTLKGKALPPDVYVWHLKKAVFADGEEFKGQRYGSITLIK